MSKRVVWWVKRDARLYDNAALAAAVATGAEVIPLYVEEPLLYGGPDWSSVHTMVYHDALDSLAKNLKHHGSALFVRQGEIIAVLEKLLRQLPFSALYSHEETGLNHTYVRDQQVATWCRERGIIWHEYNTNGVTRRLRSRDDWQQKFLAAMTAPLVPIPSFRHLEASERALAGRLTPLTPATSSTLSQVTERTAHETLRHFLYTRAIGYSGGVSSMIKAPTACSRLSIHLAWGTISLRTVFQATERRLAELAGDPSAAHWRRSLRSFASRLFWHSHFIQRLEDSVEMEYVPLNPAFARGLPVVTGTEAERRLIAWQTGTTGYPAIDAAMRYYQTTGWLNFRSRAMVTSFAVHGLRLPWQTMVYELAKIMADYVPGIHVSQVQMQTGITGINTIRVYSPEKQQIDHDPDCIFIKKHIPELSDFSPEAITNFTTDTLGTYPRPIIDFKSESKIMKDALYAIKKSEIARLEAAGVYQKHGSRKRRV
jgi:deoxyribodipyrimidine photo-lyase